MALSRRETSDLLHRYGLAPRRSLGQNFVVDPGTVARIARLASVGRGDRVVEIGAGLGSLTRELAATGAEVTAIEIDRGLAQVLRDTVPDVEIVEGDARTLDWDALLGGQPAVLVANLPYHIATPLIADLLDEVPLLERLVVMVQREVADRLTASPRTKAYGAVTVKVAYWATASIIGRVPAHVFLPRPNVESALVEIVRRPRPAADVAPERLFTLVRAGFAHRRKTLRNTLAGLVAPDDFSLAGVDGGARAEELDIEAWGRLTAAVVAREAEEVEG